MSWYWEMYIDNTYGYIYNDGEFADEMGRIEKVGGMYHAYASLKERNFRYLTDARRWVEQECRGKITTKKRKGYKPAPFGL